MNSIGSYERTTYLTYEVVGEVGSSKRLCVRGAQGLPGTSWISMINEICMGADVGPRAVQ